MIGRLIRDTLFFPPLNSFPLEAHEACNNAFNDETLRGFQFTQNELELQVNGRIFRVAYDCLEPSDHVGDVHTCIRIGGGDESLTTARPRITPLLDSARRAGTPLRLIQISPFNITVDGNNWLPSTLRENADVTFAFLRALREDQKIVANSMICHSMGATVLDGLEIRDPQLVPKTIILDRALPSVWKVGRRLLSVVKFTFLYSLAYLTGWTGDPESSILRFFQRLQVQGHASLMHREVILLETEHDFYFAGRGTWGRDFSERIRACGARAFRGSLFVSPIEFHPRAHHAVSMRHLRNRDVLLQEPDGFHMRPWERAADAVARVIFSRVERQTRLVA